MSLIITSSDAKGHEFDNELVDSNGIVIRNLREDPIDLENPASYHNFFNAPLVIPPHSEVAVQSVKYNRPQIVEVNEGDVSFYIYLGKTLTPTTNILNSVCLPMYATLKAGTYTSVGLLTAIQEAMDDYIFHPSFTGYATAKELVTSNVFSGWDMQFSSLSSDDNADTKGNFLDDALIPSAYIGNAMGFAPSTSIEYDVSTQTIWKTNTTHNSAGFLAKTSAHTAASPQSQCLSPDGGEFVVRLPDNVSGATGRWKVGLTRPHLASEGGPFYYDVTGAGIVQGQNYFCDFQVKRDENNKITLSHNMTNGSGEGNDRLRRQDVTYYSTTNAGNGGFATEIDMSDTTQDIRTVAAGAFVVGIKYQILVPGTTDFTLIGASDSVIGTIFVATGIGSGTGTATEIVTTANLTHIQFTLKNDLLKIELGDSTFTAVNTRLLADVQTLTDTGTKDKYLRPVSQAMWNLHPFFKLYTVGSSGVTAGTMTITKFEGRAMADVETNFGEDGYYYGSWYGAEMTWGASLAGPMTRGRGVNPLQLDIGNYQQSSVDYAGETGVNASYTFLGLSSAGGMYPDCAGLLNMALIVNTMPTIPQSQDFQYGPAPSTNFMFFGGPADASASRLLGFNRYSYVDTNILSTPNYLRTDNTGSSDFTTFDFQSTDTPVLTSGTSIFVRCPTLTHQSYNGATSSMSKILYHLPRFSDQNLDVGALYFTPPEMVYIALNNPNAIVLNDIQMDLVDKDEKIVKGLTGNTIVALHIREKK